MITLICQNAGKRKEFYVTFAKKEKKKNARDDHKVAVNLNSYVYNLHNFEMFLVLFGI